MRKVIDKLYKMEPAKIVWQEAEASIISSLPSHDKTSLFKTIELFSKEEKGSDKFWTSLEPFTLNYLKDHTKGKKLDEYELDLLTNGFLGTNYKIENPEFESNLMEILMDHADQKIQTDDAEFQEEINKTEKFIDQISESKPKSNDGLQIHFDKADVKEVEEFLNISKFLDEETKKEFENQMKIAKENSK